MPETLLTPTSIKLYGRVVTGLTVPIPPAPPAPATPPVPPVPPASLGANNFLENQLRAAGARFARIYGLSFEGHYYDLPKPAIFLVHGDGMAPVFRGNYHTDVDSSGVVAREWEFADNDPAAGKQDLKMWEYEKGDFSIRLDIESGPFEQILLAAALRGGPAAASGADLRSSGADLRSSGADLRISGADLRIRR
jgi:hypothetical protein